MATTEAAHRTLQFDQRRVVPTIPVEQIMQGKQEIIILHGPTEYRLRITSNGKLILTK
ncbi:MAG: hemin uptake protein HemP [Gammaproteobacteria bacterium]